MKIEYRSALWILVSLGAACGATNPEDDVATASKSKERLDGVMVIRQEEDVTATGGELCEDVVSERVLRIDSLKGKPVVATLSPGEWKPDPDIEGVLVCPVQFRADLNDADSYEFTVNDSEPLIFNREQVLAGLEFFDPSQFFEPGSYAPLPEE